MKIEVFTVYFFLSRCSGRLAIEWDELKFVDIDSILNSKFKQKCISIPFESQILYQ